MADAHSDPEAVRAYFQNFVEHQAAATDSPLYACLCEGAAHDPEMLALAALSPPSQPSANLLLAAVHYLLLGGERDPLAVYYPDVLGEVASREPDEETYPLFRDFVGRHREAIEPLLRNRLVQTNVVRRTTCLLPAFARVAEEAGTASLALLEIGCSAGLNLHWDRYRHAFERPGQPTVHWGDEASPLHLSTELRGERALPPLPDLEVAWRLGVDLDPIDVEDPDALLWLRALVFPEHVERHGEIAAAAEIARAHPAPVERGDAVDRTDELLARAPDDAALCLYSSMALNQVPGDRRELLFERIAAFSRLRPAWLVSMRGTVEGAGRIDLYRFRGGERDRAQLAFAHPHGRWLEWL